MHTRSLRHTLLTTLRKRQESQKQVSASPKTSSHGLKHKFMHSVIYGGIFMIVKSHFNNFNTVSVLQPTLRDYDNIAY